MKMAEIGENTLHLTFEDEMEMRKILTGGPWLFDNQLLILKRWWERIKDESRAFTIADI